MRSIVAFIFARGGSKGLPGKNIRSLAGRPLIAHAIEAAMAVPSISRIIVSTDDPAIGEVARTFGAEVPFLRPAELATDSAPELSAWQHAIRALQAEKSAPGIDLFVSVPAVCPLRTGADIARCIERFDKGDADLVLTVTPACANPYYTMVELSPDGAPHLVKEPPVALHGRQAAPHVFEIVAGCYVARPAHVLASTGIWDGKVRVVEIPRDRAVDIDTEIDFALAELLMQRRSQIDKFLQDQP